MIRTPRQAAADLPSAKPQAWQRPDLRRRVIDAHPGYRQILARFLRRTSRRPSLGTHGLVELVRRYNEEMRSSSSVIREPVAACIAGAPVADPHAATEEAVGSVRELGALGDMLASCDRLTGQLPWRGR